MSPPGRPKGEYRSAQHEGTPMNRVIVHIDRLVLRGFAAAERDRIAAGLRQELGRVFADGAALARWRAMGDAPALKVSGVHIAHRPLPRQVGEAVGQGIGKGMRK